MKYLKTYQLFEAKTELTPEQEAFLNEYTKGTWTYNPATGLVDVKGDFNCSERQKGFEGVKFGKVDGNFSCWRNRLTSLEGAPQEVSGHFSCSYNRLTSLEGAPQKVGGHFSCDKNKLTSLAGAPQEVRWDFDCGRNKLASLAGAPQKVDGDFNCERNELTSLAGAPQEVGGWFRCDAFTLWNGEWNLEGWLKVLQEGSPEAQNLISTILSEYLNKEIARDPAGMIMKIKEVWNDESFKKTRSKLVWPKGYKEKADLLGDLDDVGF